MIVKYIVVDTEVSDVNMVQQNLPREVFLVAFQPFIEKYSQRMYVLAIFNDIVMVLNDIQCILPVILSNPDSRWQYKGLALRQYKL